VDERSLKDAFSSFGEVTEGIILKALPANVGLQFLIIVRSLFDERPE
jgi:hypothetical protein